MVCRDSQDVVPVRLEGEPDRHRAEPGEEEAGAAPQSYSQSGIAVFAFHSCNAGVVPSDEHCPESVTLWLPWVKCPARTV